MGLQREPASPFSRGSDAPVICGEAGAHRGRKLTDLVGRNNRAPHGPILPTSRRYEYRPAGHPVVAVATEWELKSLLRRLGARPYRVMAILPTSRALRCTPDPLPRPISKPGVALRARWPDQPINSASAHYFYANSTRRFRIEKQHADVTEI